MRQERYPSSILILLASEKKVLPYELALYTMCANLGAARAR